MENSDTKIMPLRKGKIIIVNNEITIDDSKQKSDARLKITTTIYVLINFLIILIGFYFDPESLIYSPMIIIPCLLYLLTSYYKRTYREKIVFLDILSVQFLEKSYGFKMKIKLKDNKVRYVDLSDSIEDTIDLQNLFVENKIIVSLNKKLLTSLKARKNIVSSL